MQGIYDIDESVKTAQNLSTWIPPGVHENLKIVDVKYDTSKNGNEYLAFYFENEKGDKVSNTEWPIKFNKSLDDMTPDEKERALAVLENQKSKVKQIVETYKPNFNITASTFKEFAEKTVEFLGDSYKEKLVRVKVVYDKRGFTTTAQKGKYPFIESMDVSKEESRIRILASDKMERPEVPQTEATETNPLEEGDTSTEKVDTLPF